MCRSISPLIKNCPAKLPPPWKVKTEKAEGEASTPATMTSKIWHTRAEASDMAQPELRGQLRSSICVRSRKKEVVWKDNILVIKAQ
jgi:hypothetical protein